MEMYGWIRPHITVPVHGETRHLMEHAALAKELQVLHSRAAANREMLALSQKGVKLAEIVESGIRNKKGTVENKAPRDKQAEKPDQRLRVVFRIEQRGNWLPENSE